jgi:hypothetical protein
MFNGLVHSIIWLVIVHTVKIFYGAKMDILIHWIFISITRVWRHPPRLVSSNTNNILRKWYLQFMSSLTEVETGTEMLLFAAYKVRSFREIAKSKKNNVKCALNRFFLHCIICLIILMLQSLQTYLACEYRM